jgi:hypothetical protein
MYKYLLLLLVGCEGAITITPGDDVNRLPSNNKYLLSCQKINEDIQIVNYHHGISIDCRETNYNDAGNGD